MPTVEIALMPCMQVMVASFVERSVRVLKFCVIEKHLKNLTGSDEDSELVKDVPMTAVSVISKRQILQGTPDISDGTRN
jgi:hypothetical protein